MSVRAFCLAAILLLAAAVEAQEASPRTGPSSFVVSVQGRAAGTVDVSVERTPAGWSIRGVGRLDMPAAVTVRRIDVDYTQDWQPRNATLDMSTAGETVVVHGGFGGGSGARVEIIRDGRQVVFVTAPVSPHALILPALAFGAFEALAGRLSRAIPGTTLRTYVLPQREIATRLEAVQDEILRAGDRRVAVRRWRVVFEDPAGATRADVWVEQGRLARLELAGSGVSMIRRDLAAR